MTLLGRRQQCSHLDRMLADVRAGCSRVLVVRGEPGIGKTALLSYAADMARDFQVARAEGVESEMELAFAALHQLCVRMLSRLVRLPGPQRDALGVAFGLRAGHAPDRFLVGLAVLSLLSEVAAEQPLLCLIDDAQWLDQASAQVLAFVARRLDAESVAVIFSTRDPGAPDDLSGLPEQALNGLSDADARALLVSVLPGRLDERVRDRVIAESGGNPLALLELPRSVTPADLAGGFGVAGRPPLTGRIEQSFLRQIARLPEPTRRLLLVAAAEPLGDPALLRRAADRLGISVEAADAAECEGLLEFGARVMFRHPLVRSAIYRSALSHQRRDAHCALAEATDPQLDPDRYVWHRAQAAPGPDEIIAAELQRSAGRAQARGGFAAAAAFLGRSAALTPEPGQRARRALAAAHATAHAGTWDTALRLLATAEAGHLDELEQAHVDLLRAQIAVASSRGNEAPAMLLKAAERLERLDIGLARETYLQALSAAMYPGRFATWDGLRKTAEAALAAPPAPERVGAHDPLLDGLALLITKGHAAAAPALKRALSAFRGQDVTGDEGLRSHWQVCLAAQMLWDDESWDLLATSQLERAREAGALGVLPVALSQRAGLYLYEGDLAAATSLIEEATAVAEATGSELRPYARLALTAFRGQQHEIAELIETGTGKVMRPDEGVALAFIQWAAALLNNGLAHYGDALAAAQRASQERNQLVFSLWAAVELIEAAARIGVPEQAADALERISDSTQASGSDWALGIEAYARALLSDGETAERLHREALDRLGSTRIRFALARANLVYGEWLRRENRRTDAREQLRTAHQSFASMGAQGFAERAARELRATGERVRKRAIDTPSQLTARETQIAQLASQGQSNPEIAAQLFMSRRTVEYHLHKIFTKLAISSRNQLRAALGDSRSEGPRATR